MFDIHIVFVNYFMKDELLSALASVENDSAECRYSVTVTVVDNSCNRDGIREALAASHSRVFYHDAGGNLGFGRANTLGFERAPARYYFALNCDTTLLGGSRTIERIVAWMDEHPRVGCMGPKLLNLDGSLQLSCFRFDWRSLLVKPLRHLRWEKKFRWVEKHVNRLQMSDFDHAESCPVDWVMGSAMVVRKEALEQVGSFDPRYFFYMEDCDWCRAMWALGWPVYYVPEIAIMHRHARASSAVPGIIGALMKNPLTRMHAKSLAQFLWKWRKDFRYVA